MKRVFSLLVFLLLQASLAAAQTAIVSRNVILRPEASSNGVSIDMLKNGTKLILVESDQTNGFLHVNTEDGTEGWAWSRNPHVQTSVVAAANAQHVGPANLYPDPSMTPGLAATLSVDDLRKTYTDNCPDSKPSCTYSQDHRNVPASVHTKVYDKYDVPQDQRNIKNGEVDHFYPLYAAVRTISPTFGISRPWTNGTARTLAITPKTSSRRTYAFKSKLESSTQKKHTTG
jgi:hypothetical protein